MTQFISNRQGPQSTKQSSPSEASAAKDPFSAMLDEAGEADQGARASTAKQPKTRLQKARQTFLRRVLPVPPSEAEKMTEEAMDGADTEGELSKVGEEQDSRRRKGRADGRQMPSMERWVAALGVATAFDEGDDETGECLRSRIAALVKQRSSQIPAPVAEPMKNRLALLTAMLDAEDLRRLLERLRDPTVTVGKITELALASLAARDPGAPSQSIEASPQAAAGGIAGFRDLLRDGRLHIVAGFRQSGEGLVLQDGRPVAKIVHPGRLQQGSLASIFEAVLPRPARKRLDRGSSYDDGKWLIVALPAFAGHLRVDGSHRLESSSADIEFDGQFEGFADLAQCEIDGRQMVIGQRGGTDPAHEVLPTFRTFASSRFALAIDGRYTCVEHRGGQLFALKAGRPKNVLLPVLTLRPDGGQDFAAAETAGGKTYEVAWTGQILWELKATPERTTHRLEVAGAQIDAPAVVRLPTHRRGQYANPNQHGHRLLLRALRTDARVSPKTKPDSPDASPPSQSLPRMTQKEFAATYGAFSDWRHCATGLWWDRPRVAQKCYNAVCDLDLPPFSPQVDAAGVPSLLAEQMAIVGKSATEAFHIQASIRSERMRVR